MSRQNCASEASSFFSLFFLFSVLYLAASRVLPCGKQENGPEIPEAEVGENFPPLFFPLPSPLSWATLVLIILSAKVRVNQSSGY